MASDSKMMTVMVESRESDLKVTFPNGSSCVVKESEDAKNMAVEFLNANSKGVGLIDWQTSV